jgi:hypothetical protein
MATQKEKRTTWSDIIDAAVEEYTDEIIIAVVDRLNTLACGPFKQLDPADTARVTLQLRPAVAKAMAELERHLKNELTDDVAEDASAAGE